MNAALTSSNLIFLPDAMAADSYPADAEPDALVRHAAVCREACSQLTLAIVHEMNNLTGGIAVLSEVYLQEEATGGPPMGEGLDLILQSTRRLQSFVRHLKLIHGPLREEPSYLNVAGNVRCLLDLFAPVLPRDTVVETDFEPGEMAVCLDEARFRQAMLGLILNIRDALAARPGPGHGLRASLRRLSGERVELVLVPTDAGGVDIRAELPESDPHRAEAAARLDDATLAFGELGGRLTRGGHGEYIIELPLVG